MVMGDSEVGDDGGMVDDVSGGSSRGGLIMRLLAF